MDKLGKPIKHNDIMPLFLRAVVGANNEPALEIRMQVSEPEIIKALISAAYHSQPLVFLPQFRDKIKALSTLQKYGILGRNKTEEGETEYIFLM